MVGADAPSDLAVLEDRRARICRRCRSAIPTSVRVGDVVLAIGNPLGVGQTVTMGIISAKGRHDRRRRRQLSRTSCRPTRQSTSGNSGGALVNTSGELIGINSQILSPGGGNIGIGFAIPSNMARRVMTSWSRRATCAARCLASRCSR